MRRFLPVLGLLLWGSLASAQGLLLPQDKTLPPLAMINHKVQVAIDDQVAITRVDQTFHNHASRPLEATYVFPVPKGASVNKFTMWIDGKETKGELVEAAKARQIYTDIVRRTYDPGLLEYLGTDLLQMKVFPVPANGDQRVALSYTAVLGRERDLVEYVYPLRSDSRSTAKPEGFSLEVTLKAQHAVQNVYSPTHPITLKRAGDKEVTVQWDRSGGASDKDFQLFYQLGDKDVGLTALTHRPVTSDPGYVMALVTPKVEMGKTSQVPRDMVLVLDTSGSMRGAKMDQARNALKLCLDHLVKNDRFALIQFATTVNRYRESLTEAGSEQVAQAKKWVDALEATGGTAINEALASALEIRAKEESRSFTIIFFTDGQPTIGETNVDTILKNTLARNTANTRIFTFGVGDDVNAALLDQLADRTRAVSTYVRPSEDIAAKAAGLYDKISHPVLTNLKLAVTGSIALTEVYPPQLPDLFHGQQLVILGRYTGQGASALKLTGQVGGQTKEFAYDLTFPNKTGDERGFVEEIWARRKVGYMLDQIRLNGEKKELVDEVVALAKRYGITTPYTSWLIVPDGPLPIARPPMMMGRPMPGTPPGLAGPGGGAVPVAEFLRRPGSFGEDKDSSKRREALEKEIAANEASTARTELGKLDAFDKARGALKGKDGEAKSGKLGVDLALHMQELRTQNRTERAAVRQVAGRSCLEVGGVWIDEKFEVKLPTLVVKAQSDAYFRILELQPTMKDVFRLGNHLVWVTPSGTALIIDTSEGKEKLNDEEINKLFVARK